MQLKFFATSPLWRSLRHRNYRLYLTGQLVSVCGTWMQQVVLGAFAYALTGSPVFVGLMIFTQMGPVLLFGPLAGVIADTFDRKRLFLAVTSTQLASAAALALVVSSDDPSKVGIVGAVLVGGIANAVFMPAYSAALPFLVGDLRRERDVGHHPATVLRNTRLLYCRTRRLRSGAVSDAPFTWAISSVLAVALPWRMRSLDCGVRCSSAGDCGSGLSGSVVDPP